MDILHLKDNFTYNEDDGILRDKITLKDCTCNGPKGYRQIRINGRKYLAHRIVWLMIYGRWPIHNIDHINGDKTDNRIINLRDVDNRTNLQNMYKHRDGLLPGCYYHKEKKKWRAQIQIGGKRIHLGYYGTQEAAHDVYVSAIP